MEIKICGITRQQDLEAAIRAGADAAGFVVDVESSKRNLSLTEARRLIDRLPSDLNSVAVSVFKNQVRIGKILEEVRPRFMQLHGITNELADLRNVISKDKTILAIDATRQDALQRAISFSACAQSVLVDTNRPEGLGGTGETHDWSESRRIRKAIDPVHLILAGGLTPENVGDAIKAVGSFGVDVSTGVEARPGIKDPVKIAEFVRHAREADP